MDDTTHPNPELTSDPSPSSSPPAKRRKIASGGDATAEEAILSSRARWRSESSQRIYSSKLVDALRRARRDSPPSPQQPGARLVRETADRVLAAAARGRSRWSRAILARRLMRSRNKHKKTKRIGPPAIGRPEAQPQAQPRRRLRVVERKVRVLGSLVPGCRKLGFPSLLDEATDYIAALEMQVRAMTALTELLAGGAAGGS